MNVDAKTNRGSRGARSPGASKEVMDYRRIWSGARKLGMERDLVYDLAESVCGKSVFSPALDRRSLTMLNRAERWVLIQDLKAKGAFTFKKGISYDVSRISDKKQNTKYNIQNTPRPSGRDIVTPGQQDLIETLFIELASLAADFGKPEYRRGFIKIVLGKEWPQKKWEAQKIIEAVKRRLNQEKKKVRTALKGQDKSAQGKALGMGGSEIGAAEASTGSAREGSDAPRKD